MFENIKSAFRSLSSGLHCAPPLSGAYCSKVTVHTVLLLAVLSTVRLLRASSKIVNEAVI